MVIHTKEKPKLHVKSAPETKIKGRNVLTVDRSPKIVGAVKETGTDKNDRRKSAIKVKTKGEAGKQADKDKKTSGKNMRGNDRTASEKRSASGNAKSSAKEAVSKSIQKESSMYAQYRRTKQDKENAIGKKSDTAGSLASIGAKSALDQMEGGNEVYESYMAARNLSRPLESAADAGRRLYQKQAAKAKEKRIKKVQAGKKISKKAVKDSAANAAKETGKAAAKKAAKETAKTTAKAAAATAGTAAGTAATGPGGFLIGVAAGEVAGIAIDKKDMKNSTRNRMIQLFVAKLRQEENQDSIGKALKDIVLMRFSMMAKYIIRYVGLFLLALFALVALVALPIIAVIAIIYNSPFAIFFPSISSGDTTQDVLSAYVAEFNRDVNEELTNHSGYDESEKIYVDFEGAETPDNYCDILAVYMVKYGNGDTATDMTDKAKQNLKAVFDDMCSYTITSRTETEEDEEGNTTTTTIKEVNVELKTYRDMISVYGFDAEEQEMLAELMKPEYLAMMGYTGGGGDPGEAISPEQYQAIVDSISDANGKKVVEFVLSKVGYPYSQQYRDSGEYYDCSSLAYYAWQSAGVNIMYEGANTAAAEGKYCYDNNLLVNYDEMQPGDLIFYSYSKNGRFMNITHVAVYVGNGKVVEAANERIGVVYRAVQSKSSIVFIGRPR
ncbi:MAG: C40 family peptidase [Lachnospiraceae bacterium]|nr:C40 family peptidase [Lachnospiraceae bacterium]